MTMIGGGGKEEGGEERRGVSGVEGEAD